MELFNVFLGLGIFAETSYLVAKNLKQKSGNNKRKIYVDSSALMDGRILGVARTGFISDNMVIPRSVIREMQLVADGKDAEKRARARIGMDIANDLTRIEYFNVEILQDELDRTPVDERLLALAKKNRGAILTCDFNLSKVAATEDITVLNINDLALMLRAEFLPGEKLTIKINAVGTNPGQGVGHLPDGTMVVVDRAAEKVGQQATVEFVRYIQTSAGKMMFAKLEEGSVFNTRSRQKESSSRGSKSRSQSRQKNR